MAVIKAFKGMRYNTAKAGEISSLCCPPYDIISEQERLAFIKENEYNIIRLELPKEGENPYACASDILKMWQDKGILKLRISLLSIFTRKNFPLATHAKA